MQMIDSSNLKLESFTLFIQIEVEDCINNVGCILEQLEFWMASQNIGVCWYGIGKPDKLQYNGFNYVIMLAFGKGQLEHSRLLL